MVCALRRVREWLRCLWMSGLPALGIFLVVSAGAAQQPQFARAPKVGQKAPEFTLPDTTGKPVRLSELLTELRDGNPGAEKPRWLLLMFYRGYW